jgi:hypothetical protein
LHVYKCGGGPQRICHTSAIHFFFLRGQAFCRAFPPPPFLGLQVFAPLAALSACMRGASEGRAASSGRISGGNETPAAALSHSEIHKPLAFVSRYAEALDILVPNLSNTDLLRQGYDIKFMTPLAAQPPGTGKTALGLNLTVILRRPRDRPALEAAVARRPQRAWCWGIDGAPEVQQGLRDGRDENLVMRTLLSAFPHEEKLLLRLKETEPLLIRMRELVAPEFGFSFDKALA